MIHEMYFDKDHWSLLSYVLILGFFNRSVNPDYMQFGKTKIGDNILVNHNTWDCLKDLEYYGYIEISNNKLSLTSKGIRKWVNLQERGNHE